MTTNLTPIEVIANYQAQEAYNDLLTQLKDLKTRHAQAATRSDKIQLTKEINLMEAEVEKRKDSYVKISKISPKRLLEHYILEGINNLISNYEQKLKRFQERLTSSPQDAIEWESEDLIKAQVQAQKAQFLLKLIENSSTDLEKVQKFHEGWTLVQEDIKRELSYHARRGASYSTNQFANLVEQCKAAGLAHLEENYRIAGATFYTQELENYAILKEAGLLTEEE